MEQPLSPRAIAPAAANAWPYSLIPEGLTEVDRQDLPAVRVVFDALITLHSVASDGAASAASSTLVSPPPSSSSSPSKNSLPDAPDSLQIFKVGTEYYDCVAYGYSECVTLSDLDRLHRCNVQVGMILDVYIDPRGPKDRPALVVRLSTANAHMQHMLAAAAQSVSSPSPPPQTSGSMVQFRPINLDQICPDAKMRRSISEQTFSQLHKEYRPESYVPVNDIACAITYIHAIPTLTVLHEYPDLPIYFGWNGEERCYVFMAFGFARHITVADLRGLYYRSDLAVRRIGYSLTMSKSRDSAPGMLLMEVDDRPAPSIAAIVAAAAPPPASDATRAAIDGQASERVDGNIGRKRRADDRDNETEPTPERPRGYIWNAISNVARVLLHATGVDTGKRRRNVTFTEQ